MADKTFAAKMKLSQVARSFFFLFMPMAILLGGIVALLSFQEAKSRQVALQLKETSRLNTQKGIVTSHIQAIATDVLTVSEHYELHMMLDHNASQHRESLASEFLWFARIKKIYDQVRYLDECGMEILRVNYNNGTPAIVPSGELQSKVERYYFKDTYRLADREVFVSPFDLNIEHGQIEQPIKPMIRFGTPVFDSKGNKRGIVLLNYLGAHLLNTLEVAADHNLEEILLLNSEGYYLHGLNRADEWGFMYGDKKDRTFAREHPQAWQTISRAEAGQLSNGDGLYTFTTIRPFSEAQVSSTGSGEPFSPSQKLIEGTAYHWKLVSHIPPVMLPLSGGPLVRRSLVIYAVMLVFSAFGCGYVAYAGVKRRQAEAEVRDHRDYLKQLVEQRTSELTNLNRQLQTDINERERVERELRESEEKYRSMMEAMDDPAYICSDDYRITYMNSAMVERTGRNAVGERCSQVIHKLEEQCPWCVHQRVMNGEHVKTEVVSPQDQRTYQVSHSPIFHQDGSVSKLTIFRDNTEVKAIEAQLQQAQKLESVGRLAGGVAHDYNNALSVIMGFTELTLNSMPADNPLNKNLNEILKAARTATDITRQLLTFARKQEIAPKVLDLNGNVDQILKMLRRLIGEDIDLVWVPGADLWPVMMDPSQVSQILANLCVNSRDAIIGVGKITIETKNTSFDEVRSTSHVDARPGDYVRLAVSDDGCGMAKEIVENIFEPFFTTKNVDKGTGLGLSTVYGIVKQNNGFINVHSEPGHGTAISIYLPRHAGQPARCEERKRTDMPAGKGETILLVEDDLPFLRLTRKILDILGYTLLTASTPTGALKLAEMHADRIHLLITDVIMPEMDGKELARRMKAFCPKMKHMFMSGYTADVIRHRGKLDENVRLLHKPFAMKDLAEAVQVALNG